MSVGVKIIGIVLLVLSGAGCDFRGGAESAHPLFKNAEAARENGNYQAAADFLNRYLTVRYDSPQTHLRLATLYDENLDAPLQAVYHYQQFLRYAPDSPERQDVKKWIEAAKRKYYLHARLEYNDPEDVEMLKNSLEKNRAQLAQTMEKHQQMLAYVDVIKKQLAALNRETTQLRLQKGKAGVDLELAREQIDQLREQNAALVKEQNTMRERLQTMERMYPDQPKTADAVLPHADAYYEGTGDHKATEPVAKTIISDRDKVVETQPSDSIDNDTAPRSDELQLPQTEATTTPDSEQESPRNYQVQRGDTLIKISRQFYGSGKHYRLIYEANRNILPSESSLSPGQYLIIPALPDSAPKP